MEPNKPKFRFRLNLFDSIVLVPRLDRNGNQYNRYAAAVRAIHGKRNILRFRACFFNAILDKLRNACLGDFL